jgi:hypothetical protein
LTRPRPCRVGSVPLASCIPDHLNSGCLHQQQRLAKEQSLSLLFPDLERSPERRTSDGFKRRSVVGSVWSYTAVRTKSTGQRLREVLAESSACLLRGACKMANRPLLCTVFRPAAWVCICVYVSCCESVSLLKKPEWCPKTLNRDPSGGRHSGKRSLDLRTDKLVYAEHIKAWPVCLHGYVVLFGEPAKRQPASRRTHAGAKYRVPRRTWDGNIHGDWDRTRACSSYRKESWR